MEDVLYKISVYGCKKYHLGDEICITRQLLSDKVDENMYEIFSEIKKT